MVIIWCWLLLVSISNKKKCKCHFVLYFSVFLHEAGWTCRWCCGFEGEASGVLFWLLLLVGGSCRPSLCLTGGGKDWLCSYKPKCPAIDHDSKCSVFYWMVFNTCCSLNYDDIPIIYLFTWFKRLFWSTVQHHSLRTTFSLKPTNSLMLLLWFRLVVTLMEIRQNKPGPERCGIFGADADTDIRGQDNSDVRYYYYYLILNLSFNIHVPSSSLLRDVPDCQLVHAPLLM